jgi:hypothetical protein
MLRVTTLHRLGHDDLHRSWRALHVINNMIFILKPPHSGVFRDMPGHMFHRDGSRGTAGAIVPKVCESTICHRTSANAVVALEKEFPRYPADTINTIRCHSLHPAVSKSQLQLMSKAKSPLFAKQHTAGTAPIAPIVFTSTSRRAYTIHSCRTQLSDGFGN